MSDVSAPPTAVPPAWLVGGTGTYLDELDGRGEVDGIEWGPGLDPRELMAEIHTLERPPTPSVLAVQSAAGPVPDDDPTDDPRWLPGYRPGVARYLVGGRLVEVPERPSADVSAAEYLRGALDARRAAQDALVVRPDAVLPPPERPATPLALDGLAKLCPAASQLATAAHGAGWTVTATVSRGPWPTQASRCPRCQTWTKVTQAGVLAVHGPKTARCERSAPDPDSPAFRTVDAVVVRAVLDSERGTGHRLGGVWVGTGEGGRVAWSVERCELYLAGYRSVAIKVNDLKATLKRCATVEQYAMVRGANADTHTKGAHE